ncbi:MAG: 50S ribosomal protein L32e [Candidatus Aenigmarchaeota archaeon]|nr:50S ribosomal protein L32e [Candidatus Aenigmarchaeota archaeon]
MVNPRNNPKFVRWLSVSLKRVKSSWRLPKGINSKVAQKKKGKLPMPNVGYGAPRKMRYLHPSGFKEILVHNVDDLVKVDIVKEAVKIASSVGGKKKSEILKKAEEMKLKVLNP